MIFTRALNVSRKRIGTHEWPHGGGVHHNVDMQSNFLGRRRFTLFVHEFHTPHFDDQTGGFHNERYTCSQFVTKPQEMVFMWGVKQKKKERKISKTNELPATNTTAKFETKQEV